MQRWWTKVVTLGRRPVTRAGRAWPRHVLAVVVALALVVATALTVPQAQAATAPPAGTILTVTSGRYHSDPASVPYGYIGSVNPSTGAVTKLVDIHTTDSAGTVVSGSAAAAVSPDGTKVYFIGKDGNTGASTVLSGLFVYDFTTNTFTQLTAPALDYTSTNYLSTPTPDTARLAMDPSGTLWTVDYNGYAWSYVPGSGATTWTNRGSVSFPNMTGKPYYGDVAFGGAGNMWITVGDANGVTRLYTISQAQLGGTDGAAASYVSTLSGLSDPITGIAFGTNGTLYAQTAGSMTTQGSWYSINTTTGAISTIGTGTSAINGTDLASSAFPNPSITVTKTASPATIAPGGTITYTVTVRNTGVIGSTGTTFQDSLPAGTTYVSSSLNGTAISGTTNPWATAAEVHSPGAAAGVVAPGASATVTLVAQAPATFPSNLAQICNQGTGTYSGGPASILTDDPAKAGATDPTCTPTAPAIAVDKASEISTLSTNPQQVVYSYVVTNARVEPLRTVAVSDDKCSPVTYASGDANADGILQPGESWRYTCTATLTTATTNVATATATGVTSGVAASATDSWTVGLPTPRIAVDKTASTSALTTNPQQVTYTYAVTAASAPTGGTPSGESLKNVSVTDDKCSPVTYRSGDTDADGLLDVGETWTYTCAASITATTTNTATAKGTGAASLQTVSATDSWTVTAPALAVTKTSDTGGRTLQAGDTVTYTMTVRNTGATDQTHVTLTDPLPAGTTYVAGSATKSVPTTTTTTQTGTYQATLPSVGFDTSATQTVSPGTAIPAGATLTGYTVTMNGTTNPGVNAGLPGYQQEVSVAATLPGGAAWFAVDRNGDADNNEFGTAGSGPWTQVTRSGSWSRIHATADTYTLTWYDSYNNSPTPDQVASNVQVSIPWTLTTSSRAAATTAAGAPANLVTSADNVTLQPGETMTVTFKVVVGATAPASLTNTATANTDAALPLSASVTDAVAQPAWAVSKTVDGTRDTGTAVTAAADGTATVHYVVAVRNTGTGVGTTPAVTDTLSLPAGFAVTRVTLTPAGGTATTPTLSGSTFTIPAGTTVAAGASTTWAVDAVVKAADVATADWASAGTCSTAGTGDATKGAFNAVTLTGDSDGTSNNDACVPLLPPTVTIAVHKQGTACDVGVPTCPAPGAAFAIYSTDPATAGATPLGQLTAAANGSDFTSGALVAGRRYWLVETQAATGHQLLADPIRFTLDVTGITLESPAGTANGTTVAVTGADRLGLTVTDPATGPLPEAGGSGTTWYLLVGLVLLAAAAILARPTRREAAR